jgi:hypothetical protein
MYFNFISFFNVNDFLSLILALYTKRHEYKNFILFGLDIWSTLKKNKLN